MLVSGLRRLRTARQRLGLGLGLSALVHLLALVALMVLIARGDRPAPSAVAERPALPAAPALPDLAMPDHISISDVSEPVAGPVGDTPAPGSPAAEPTPLARAPKRTARAPDPTADRARPSSMQPAPSNARVSRTATVPPAEPVARAPTRPALRTQAATQPPPGNAPTVAGAPTGTADAGSGPAPSPGGSPPPADPTQARREAFREQLKRIVKASWQPQEIYQRVDPHGRLKGSMLVTAVQVRLRGDGSLEQAQVSGTSGVPALDDEALAAIRRMKLPALPAEILDDRRGFDIKVSLHLDVGAIRFAKDIHQAIARSWRPSPAYRAAEGVERKTIVRLSISRDGQLQNAAIVTSAGIDFLDNGALAAVKPGTRLPPPPPAFTNPGGPITLFVAFQHHLGELHVLRPRERIDED